MPRQMPWRDEVEALKADVSELKKEMHEGRRETAHISHKLDKQDFQAAQYQSSIANLVGKVQDLLRELISQAGTANEERSKIVEAVESTRRDVVEVKEDIRTMKPDVELVASARKGVGIAKKTGKWAMTIGGGVFAFISWWHEWWPSIVAWVKGLFIR